MRTLKIDTNMAHITENGRGSCSLLESLPTEILILILSATARYPRDLGSLIRTCYTIYRCFEAFTPCILTAPAREDLGPVFRDVVALAYTPCLCFITLMDDEYRENVQECMHRYHQIAKAHKNITLDMTTEMALRILHLNRAASFFTDLYMASRRACIADQLVYGAIATDGQPPFTLINSPASENFVLTEEEIQTQRTKLGSLYRAMCHDTLSLTERRRLAQAFFRAELMTNLRCSKTQLQREIFSNSNRMAPPGLDQMEKDEGLLDSIFAPFTPWEMELVSQAHYFISSVCRALIDIGWTATGGRVPDGWMDSQTRLNRVTREYQFDLVAFRETLVDGGADTCISTCIPCFDPSTEREIELIPTTSLLDLTREVFLTVPSCHPDTTSPVDMECHLVICQLLEVGPGRQNGTDMANGGTNCLWLCASHRHRGGGRDGWPPVGSSELGSEAQSQAEEEKDNKAANTVLPTPYAWTNALNGQQLDRWGHDMVTHPPVLQRQKSTRVNHLFSRWRWLGFMFWDQERVEAMKAALGGHATGWLPRIYDDVGQSLQQ